MQNYDTGAAIAALNDERLAATGFAVLLGVAGGLATAFAVVTGNDTATVAGGTALALGAVSGLASAASGRVLQKAVAETSASPAPRA